MSVGVFVVALVCGAALLALWLDVRFPRLAPRALGGRVTVALLAGALFSIAPAQASVVSLVGVLLPALSFVFLTGLWLLRMLAERG